MLLEEKKEKYILNIEYLDNIINLTGYSIPENAVSEWIPFINEIKERVIKYDDLIINFKLNAFNTSSSLYLNTIFAILEKYMLECNIIINWYYLITDEDMFDLGETYQERFKLKFNLFSWQ